MVILIAVFLVFGPRKVPEIARQLGKGMNELKKVTSDITREFQEGARQVKNEVDQIKNDVVNESAKATQNVLAGPSVFEDEIIPDNPPDNQKESPIPAAKEEEKNSQSGIIPRN